jgi:hypothetical protein
VYGNAHDEPRLAEAKAGEAIRKLPTLKCVEDALA